MSDIISIFAFISTIIFSISQIYIIYLVKRNLKEGLKMTSSFSILSCLFSQLIWYVYYERKDKITIRWCYLVGAIFSFIWMSSYLFFYSKEMKNKNLYLFLYIFTILDLIFEITFIEIDTLNKNNHNETRKKTVNILASIFNVLMYITPGANIFKFFTEFDFNYIILPISIVGLINSFIWLFYGIISDDKDNKYPYIYSNIFGISVCTIQLILYFLFRKKKSELKIDKDILISDKDSNSTKSRKRKNKKRKKTKNEKKEHKEENDDLLDII